MITQDQFIMFFFCVFFLAIGIIFGYFIAHIDKGDYDE